MIQFHGSNISVVTKKDAGKVIPDCDGLVTASDEVKLSIKVADCLPIFISDLKGEARALVHAGWRGLNAGIIKNAVGKMVSEFKVKPENMAVFIGPHICVSHFEVKSDVLSKFKKYRTAIIKKDKKTYLDLAEIAKLQLMENRIDSTKIRIDKTCTFEDKKLFSYRRDKTDKRNVFLF